MDFKENIANTLNKVKASEDLDKKILDATVNKSSVKFFRKKNVFFRKLSFIVAILVFVSVGGAVAKAIIENYYFTKTQEGNKQSEVLSVTGKVMIKDNAMIDCNNPINLKEIEEDLGVSFLISSDDYLDYCYANINNENKIENVIFELRDVDLGEMHDVIVNISFMTQNASSEIEKSFLRAAGIEYISSGDEESSGVVETYYSKKLKTTIYMVREGNEYFESYVAFFVYDNIVYVLFPTAATKEQIITTLESLV